MPSRTSHKPHEAVVNTFIQTTGYPITLYEIEDERVQQIFSPESRQSYETHCKLIQESFGGRRECEADEARRARMVIEQNWQKPAVTICYAGVYNVAVPVVVNDKVVACFSFGEFLPTDAANIAQAIENHEEAVTILKLKKGQSQELRCALLEHMKRRTEAEIEELMDIAKGFAALLTTLYEREQALESHHESLVHEIHTTLQPILAEAELLKLRMEKVALGDLGQQGQLLVQDIQRRCQVIVNSTRHASSVAYTMGDFLPRYQFRKVNIAQLLRESCDLYDQLAKRRFINLELEIQETSIEIEVSQNHFFVALNNLIHNAIKYSYQGNEEKYRYVLVSGYPVIEGHQSFYRIKTQNYGIGILPSERVDIFKDGYQGELTVRESRTGTGKGLAFVKRTIEDHQGRIYVSSRPIDGNISPDRTPHITTFIIDIPYTQRFSPAGEALRLF